MKLSDLDSYAAGKILAGCIDLTGYVVINNPERHNAVSLAMYEAAAEVVEAMALDDNVRLLIICGAGGKLLLQGPTFPNLKKNGQVRRKLQLIQLPLPGSIMPYLRFQNQQLRKSPAIVSVAGWGLLSAVISGCARINHVLLFQQQG